MSEESERDAQRIVDLNAALDRASEQIATLTRERDEARALLGDIALSADLRSPAAIREACDRLRAERDDVRADLLSCEHDLARLIYATGWDRDRVLEVARTIESNGRPGWVARALSPETKDVVRNERALLAEARAEVERLRACGECAEYCVSAAEDLEAARAELATIRTYLARALRECDPRVRVAIESDLEGEQC